MHARVWKLRISPGKLAAFQEAIRSLLPPARKQAGFRGVVVLRGQKETADQATVIAVWDSLEQLKASEKNLFLYEAIARVLGTAAYPDIEEREVLLFDFAGK